MLGVGLFAAIARQIDRELDASVRRAALELIGAARVREMEARQARGAVVDAVDELHIPDRGLYLFDGAGNLIRPDTAHERLRAVAREAARGGVVEREFAEAREGRTHPGARRTVQLADGHWYVAMAVADRVELEDRYALLIAAFAVAALAGLGLVIGGGALLARKSTVPVQQAFEQMRRFMADAAHELRTPITVLRTRADVARQRAREPAAYVATLAEIERDAARMGAIVDDLLTLARADAGERGCDWSAASSTTSWTVRCRRRGRSRSAAGSRSRWAPSRRRPSSGSRRCCARPRSSRSTTASSTRRPEGR